MLTDPTTVTHQIETHRARVAELAPAGPVRTSGRSWARRLRHADWSSRARSLASGARRRLAGPSRPSRPTVPVAPAAACALPGGLRPDGRAAGIGARSRMSR